MKSKAKFKQNVTVITINDIFWEGFNLINPKLGSVVAQGIEGKEGMEGIKRWKECWGCGLCSSLVVAGG